MILVGTGVDFSLDGFGRTPDGAIIVAYPDIGITPFVTFNQQQTSAVKREASRQKVAVRYNLWCDELGNSPLII